MHLSLARGYGVLLNVDDYRRAARRYLPRMVRNYVEGGAEDERCLLRNRADLDAITLVPRVLRDTRAINTEAVIFGRTWAMPVGVAPIGLAGLLRPGGDGQLAKGASRAGVPFVLSSASNERLEDVRVLAPQALQWMQLYVLEDRTIAEAIVERAERAGYEALVLTVDVPVSGARERDARNGLALPLRLGPRALGDMLLHPAWLCGLARHGPPRFANLAPRPGAAASAQAQAALLARTMDRGLTWDSIAWLRGLWRGCLLLKGLLHPDDAERALDHGVDGIVVSNHGGRQWDAAPSAIASLRKVADRIRSRVPVLYDGGIRRGSDVVRALSLGASAVLVGRPALYGLACGGAEGVASVLQILRAELERSMILLGARTAAELREWEADTCDVPSRAG